MNLLYKLLAGRKPRGDLAEEKLAISHAAIMKFREDKISEGQVLARLMAGFIIVPLFDEPEREGFNIKRWAPAIFVKPNGSEWAVVFTDSKAHVAFADKNNYHYALTISTEWVLDVLPPERGLMFNPDTPQYME